MYYLVTCCICGASIERFPRIVRTGYDLTKMDNVILYDFLWRADEDDFFDPENCQIEVERITPDTLNSQKKEKIMKDLYNRTSEGIMDILQLPEEEHSKMDEWLAGQNVSLEELQSAEHMSREYEIHRINVTPENELPLLLGSLKSDAAKTRLSERMRQ